MPWGNYITKMWSFDIHRWLRMKHLTSYNGAGNLILETASGGGKCALEPGKIVNPCGVCQRCQTRLLVPAEACRQPAGDVTRSKSALAALMLISRQCCINIQ